MMSKEPPIVVQTWVRNPAYWTAMPALLTFNGAILGFALTPVLPPPNPLLLIEVVIAATSFVAIGLIILHMADKWLKVSRFGFLATIFSAALVILGFVFGESENASIFLRLDILLFLISGLLIAISMHIVYGD